MRGAGPVLVTGADGFIGRHLTETLANGYECGPVHGLVRRRPRRPLRNVRYHVVAISDGRASYRLLRAVRPRIVFHLAGTLRRDDPRLVETNALGTLALMRALAGSSVRRVVLASTCEVYGNSPAPFRETQLPRPLSAYARSKRAAERIALALGKELDIPVTALRFSVVYGPGQKPGMFIPDLVRAARHGKPFPMTEGRQKRDFLHVADAVSALVSAGVHARSGNHVFNIACGTSVSLRVAARYAERCVHRRFVRLGAVPYRPLEIRDYSVDVSRVRRTLGWRPGIPLDAGLASLVIRGGRP